jgi:signal transduction histidine kinase
VVTPAWRTPWSAIVLAAALLGVATAGYLRAIGGERRERLAAWEATAFVASVVAARAAVRLADPDTQAATLLVQQLSLCVLAVLLLAGLLAEPWTRLRVTDLVVELSEERSGALRSELARVLGDPTLEVGYWSNDAGAYVDEAGRALALPAPGEARTLTRIDRDGRAVAALVHDPAVLDDPTLVEAVAAASKLAASYARLRADVRAQSIEVQESRTRLLRAADAERERLERRLHDGAERPLLRIGQLLDEADGGPQLDYIREQLEGTLAELHELARGLHPSELSENGLAVALAPLAARSPLPVELSVEVVRLPGEVEVAVWFVCAEALANAVRYSGASQATVAVVADGRVARVEIADDGSGGADLDRGTGLRGLADRLDALGGTLRVESPPGGGTRVIGELPL